ncbi:MAG: hypothetical protein ACLRMZ_28500 [Blautia marasmi]
MAQASTESEDEEEISKKTFRICWKVEPHMQRRRPPKEGSIPSFVSG